MAECSSCRAPIIWAEHETTGKRTCLDAEPTEQGCWHIIDQLDLNGDTKRLYAHGPKGGHASHFSTCPHADSHRNPVEPA